MGIDATTEQILRRLQRSIAGHILVDPERFVLDSKLSDIGVDSFSLVELVFLAEEEFAIKIPFDGLVVNTVRDVVDVIHREIVQASPLN